LSTRPLVYLGKVSYSLYLWHFPLLAFGFYVGLGDLPPVAIAGLLALALLLSVLSWIFVEQPARRGGRNLRWRSVAAFAACGVLALFGTGLMVQLKGGFPARLDDSASRLIAGQPLRNPDRRACLLAPTARTGIGDLCAIGAGDAAPSFVLWGDSHAETLRGALGSAAAASGQSGLFAGENACPPLIGVTRPQKPACQAISEAYFRLIVDAPSIRNVVLAARWGWWAERLPYKREGGSPITLALLEPPANGAAGNHTALSAGLERTISGLLAAGKRVWLVGPIPEVGYDVPRYFHLRAIGFADGLEIAPTLAEFGQRQAFVLSLMGDLARRYPIGTIWPHERLCNDVGCEIARDGHLLYSDDDHLSVFGAHSIADLFKPVFD
jgi:hypothetical protein